MAQIGGSLAGNDSAEDSSTISTNGSSSLRFSGMRRSRRGLRGERLAYAPANAISVPTMGE
jgi:hypothetical protein